MMFDWIILFLIWFILIILLISIIFYNRLRIRDYYFSSSSVNGIPGDAITFTQSGDYYTTSTATSDLVFRPLYSDRKRNISGGLVLLTYSTTNAEEYYRIKVVDSNNNMLSEGIYRIDPKLCYNNINFSIDKGDNRQISFQFQKVDNKTNKTVTGSPSQINLVKAWSYYY